MSTMCVSIVLYTFWNQTKKWLVAHASHAWPMLQKINELLLYHGCRVCLPLNYDVSAGIFQVIMVVFSLIAIFFFCSGLEPCEELDEDLPG